MRFTVRRPACAEVSPCCHRPSGGDVACGVDVGIVRPRAAGHALENRLALAIFRRDVPAVGASLRCIRCWNEFEPPLGLVLQPGHQQSPPLAADLTVEAAFLRDVGARALTTTARRAGHAPAPSSPRRGWCRSGAPLRWWSFPPSHGGDRFRGRTTGQWPASFVLAGQIRVAPEPAAAAICAAAWFVQHQGQEHTTGPR